MEVTVDRAVLDWDLGKLLQGKLWIKSLVVTHPVVKVADSEPTPEEPSEPFVCTRCRSRSKLTASR